MNIGLVSTSVSRKAGGLYFSVRSLGKALSADGAEVSVFGLRDQYTDQDLPSWVPLSPQICRTAGPAGLGFSPELLKTLASCPCDILHTQGIWQGHGLGVWRWHQKTRKPYLISPRGMLDPWALANSRWKKRMAGVLFERNHLRDAACLHALCGSEADSMRQYGLRQPICVIPNGVDLPASAAEGSEGREESGPRIFLFLGRLHPKKGLVNALRAWAAAREPGGPEWRLVIAGWDQGGHEAELKRLATELGLGWSDARAAGAADGEGLWRMQREQRDPVWFAGPVFGEAKEQLLRRADAFLLPSFSEGLPMAVLEAWAYGLPVWMTDHCNLPEGFAARAAVRTGTDVESLAEGFRRLRDSSPEELRIIGSRGRRLVEEQFTWSSIAGRMRAVYEWLLGAGARPDAVRL